jgi:hypothetical protein
MIRMRKVRVVAQDPSLLDREGAVLTSVVAIPAEELDDGPHGHRVAVIDYDSTYQRFYEPWRDTTRPLDDKLSDDTIIHKASFHALNVFALVMRTVARFERALGRRVSWGFDGQLLNVVPHAFQEANAFYSREDNALLFGYFPSSKQREWIYTALSHDIIVHETTHALVDGIRNRYLEHAHPDQAGFHEGFADLIALLSAMTIPDLMQHVLQHLEAKHFDGENLIKRSALNVDTLGETVLLRLADQFGEELSGIRGQPLRRSLALFSEDVDVHAAEFGEPHRRGELLVAAMMRTFMSAWLERLEGSGDHKGPVNVAQAAQEANDLAELMLDISIKALDYAPPIDLQFGDFLSALLTSDEEIRPDDSKYNVRRQALKWFRELSILPTSPSENGTWIPPTLQSVRYDDTHIDSIQRSPEEVLRFLWLNREVLRLHPSAYTKVLSVRPSLRIGPDGFVVRETIAEYKQSLSAYLHECPSHFRDSLPPTVPRDRSLPLEGGGLLIFDEYGRLKHHVYQRVFGDRQIARFTTMWKDNLMDDEMHAIRLSLRTLHAARREAP